MAYGALLALCGQHGRNSTVLASFILGHRDALGSARLAVALQGIGFLGFPVESLPRLQQVALSARLVFVGLAFRLERVRPLVLVVLAWHLSRQDPPVASGAFAWLQSDGAVHLSSPPCSAVSIARSAYSRTSGFSRFRHQHDRRLQQAWRRDDQPGVSRELRRTAGHLRARD